MFQGLQTSWWPPHPPAEAPPPHVLLSIPKPPWQVEKEKQEKEQKELEIDEKAKHAKFLREKQNQMEKMKEKEKERKKILEEEKEKEKKEEQKQETRKRSASELVLEANEKKGRALSKLMKKVEDSKSSPSSSSAAAAASSSSGVVVKKEVVDDIVAPADWKIVPSVIEVDFEDHMGFCRHKTSLGVSECTKEFQDELQKLVEKYRDSFWRQQMLREAKNVLRLD